MHREVEVGQEFGHRETIDKLFEHSGTGGWVMESDRVQVRKIETEK